MICQKCGRTLFVSARGVLCPQGCAYPLHPMVTRNDDDALLADWQAVGSGMDKPFLIDDDEARWDALFAASQVQLEAMANEALAEYHAGLTEEGGFGDELDTE